MWSDLPLARTKIWGSRPLKRETHYIMVRSYRGSGEFDLSVALD